MNPLLITNINQALAAFQAGDFEKAKLIINRVIKVDSKNAPALHIMGLILVSNHEYKEAIKFLLQAVKITPQDSSIQFNLAKAFSDSGLEREAIPYYKKTVELSPGNPDGWLSYGKALSSLKRYEEALTCLERALDIRPQYAEAALNKGAVLKELKRYEEAVHWAQRALELNPQMTAALNNQGVAFKALNKFEDALGCYDQAISQNPKYFEVLTNKGAILYELNQFDNALACYDQAIEISPNYVQAWVNKGVTLHALRRHQLALACYDRAIEINPDYVQAWLNKGITLDRLRCYQEALNSFDFAISKNPNSYELHLKKGGLLQKLKSYDLAVDSYNEAILLNPNSAEVWYSKGSLFNDMGSHSEALLSYQKALSISDEVDWLLGDFSSLAMRVCFWDGLEDRVRLINSKLDQGIKVIHPFALLALVDNPILHSKASKILIQDRYPNNQSLIEPEKSVAKEKIRIGYFSADFRSHAVSFLIAELIELHDRKNFEIFAFSTKDASSDDAMRERLEKSFDQFISVVDLEDADAAARARALKIDIAVDLGGHTDNGAPLGIFSYRAAPIQVTYLGYPGTTGADYIDYIIADKVLIPQEARESYSEKIVYLPDTYQANDRNRIVPTCKSSRSLLGLPENGFVFCCFNNSYKIEPLVFDSWMRILRAVDGSVLWLLHENALQVENLKKEAQQRGISADRIVFADRTSLTDHLARQVHADLFLDTFFYNAHTTASDALWVGLPVLTLKGHSFPSRVAASLLYAIDLSELVTESQEEYESAAINLAHSPERMSSIKNKLDKNKLIMPLFDAPLFTKNIEAAYIKMTELHRNQSSPVDIVV